MAVCLVFNVRGKLIFFTSLGGAIGWFVYLLCRKSVSFFGKIKNVFGRNIFHAAQCRICITFFQRFLCLIYNSGRRCV